MNQKPDVPPIGPVPLEPTLSVIMVALFVLTLLLGAVLLARHRRPAERGKRVAIYGFCAFTGLGAAWYLEAWWPLAVTLVAIPLMMTGVHWVRRHVTSTPGNAV